MRRIDVGILLSEGVEFEAPGLIVTDEQHRFGVKQRTGLCSKGENPHVYVMSATPIPRTLSLMIYGDLDVSLIDTMPPGRKRVDTFVVDESYRQRLNGFIQKQVDDGHQVYIVCPAVEEKEDDILNFFDYNPFEIDTKEEKNSSAEIKSAVSYAKELKERVFPSLNIEFIHGKMKGKEKDKIMSDFADGKIDVLVSTTVIEVGVNVPNSNIMVIENAERFGLAQLHQLRGRVGRGEYKSYCILKYEGNSEVIRKRMQVMQDTNDGFIISEKDLELRGSGEFFGTKQHGLPEFKIANLFEDIKMLKLVQNVSMKILQEDPLLEKYKLGSLHHAFIASDYSKELKGKKIPLEEMENYPLLMPKNPSTSRALLAEFCKEYGITLTTKLEIASASLLEDFVRIGLGVGLVTTEFATKDIEEGKLFEVKTEPKLPSKYFSLITLKDSHHSFGANKLMEMIMNDVNKKDLR